MGQITFQIPQAGLANTTEDPKIATALQTLLTLVNGNIDFTNLTPIGNGGASWSGSVTMTGGGSSVLVPFDTLLFGTFDTTTTHGFVVPTTGIYQVNAQVFIVAAGSLYGGVTVQPTQVGAQRHIAAPGEQILVSNLLSCVQGDVITVLVNSDTTAHFTQALLTVCQVA